jgi:hypothetical protein
MFPVQHHCQLDHDTFRQYSVVHHSGVWTIKLDNPNAFLASCVFSQCGVTFSQCGVLSHSADTLSRAFPRPR